MADRPATADRSATSAGSDLPGTAGEASSGAEQIRDFPMPRILAERAQAWLEGRRGEVAAPRASATVMLVRDGRPPGMQDRLRGSLSEDTEHAERGERSLGAVEVFMLRRVASMTFAPSMWVFPGGGVDKRDADPDLPWAGPSPADWARVLRAGSEAEAREFVIAAVREVFEECGVLLAGPDARTVVADLRTDPGWGRDREALLTREQSFAQMLIRRGLVLRSDLLTARGHWTTPEFEPRRYDTRFFVARLPEGQVPDDLTTEADHADWTDPAALLRDYAEGRDLMLPPTVVSVEQIAAAASADALLAEQVLIKPVLPWPVADGAGALFMRCRLPA